MKPVLVIGLGNPLMGDDGAGCQAAEALAADPRLPDCVEIVCGGTDLLRCAAAMEGRERIVLLDAMADEPGTVAVFDDLQPLESRQQHAHHLSAVAAVRLLQLTIPARFTLIGIGVGAAEMGRGLSVPLAAAMPAVVDRVLCELRRRNA